MKRVLVGIKLPFAYMWPWGNVSDEVRPRLTPAKIEKTEAGYEVRYKTTVIVIPATLAMGIFEERQ